MKGSEHLEYEYNLYSKRNFGFILGKTDMRSRLERFKVKCDLCGAILSGKSTLKLHKQQEHSY